MKSLLLAKNNIPARNIILAHPLVSFTPFLTKSLFILIASLICVAVNAQDKTDAQKEAEYKKALTERSAKIVNTLGLADAAKQEKVLSELVNQYMQVNMVHDQFKASVTEIKARSITKEDKDAAIKKQEEEKRSRLSQRHNEFIAHLKEVLTDEQIESVKDGMTYRVFPITYAAYQDMLLNLTTEQKSQIYAWLKEARELAMDEGSSDDKHKVFGKYKGRINNYLSAAGYDLKKETEAWQKRIKEKEAARKQDSQ